MKRFRSFLYHKDCRAGKIFTDEEEFNQAKEDGWVESPKEISTVTKNPMAKSTVKLGRPPQQGKR